MDAKKEPKLSDAKEDSEEGKAVKYLQGIFASDMLLKSRLDGNEKEIENLIQTVTQLVQQQDVILKKLTNTPSDQNGEIPVTAPINPQEQNQNKGGAIEELTQKLGSLNELTNQS